MNLFIYLVKLIYMIKFLVALAFGILDFRVLNFKNSKRYSSKDSSLVDVIAASPPTVPNAFLFHPVHQGLFDATRA